MSRNKGLDLPTVPTCSVENELSTVIEIDDDFDCDFESEEGEQWINNPRDLLQDSDEDNKILIREILPAAYRSMMNHRREFPLGVDKYPGFCGEKVEGVGVVRFFTVYQGTHLSIAHGVKNGQRYVLRIDFEDYDYLTCDESSDPTPEKSFGPEPVEKF